MGYVLLGLTTLRYGEFLFSSAPSPPGKIIHHHQGHKNEILQDAEHQNIGALYEGFFCKILLQDPFSLQGKITINQDLSGLYR